MMRGPTLAAAFAASLVAAAPAAIALAAETHPIVYSGRVENLDIGGSSAGTRMSWDGQFRIGTDEHRLVAKSEGERIRRQLESAELQLLYDRPIGEFWDLQVGWRRDFKPANRNYFAFGIAGLAPNFFEIETTGFVSEKGAVSGRFKGGIDLSIARGLFGDDGFGLFVEPSIEVNAASKADHELKIGSGFTSVKPALQVRYEFERWFAPYVEGGWDRKLGQTARFAREEGERPSNLYLVVGIRSWF